MDKTISDYLYDLAIKSFRDGTNKTFFEAHKILRIEKNVIYVYMIVGAYKDERMCDWSVGPLKIQYKNNEIISIDEGNKDSNLDKHYNSFIPEDLIETCYNENIKDEFYQKQIRKYLNKER